MNIYLNTSPTSSGHAHRGIGAYTRHLLSGLEQTEVTVVQDRHKADLIHIPYFDLFSVSLPVLELLPFSVSKKPVVVTIHDVIPLLYPQAYPVGKKGRCSLWLQKKLLKYVAHIITDSNA